MKTATILIASALWHGRADARDETILHGWQGDPNGRGTWTILWSCLATIFICTWSALHLDVPNRHEWWYLMLRKLGWMCIASTAPEIVLLYAAENFFLAQKLSKHLKNQDRAEWTLTHMQFAVAGGFRTRTSHGKISKITAEKLRELIETDQIPDPPVSGEELRSRSKSDWIIKTVAIFQIAWFGIQTLFRAIQHFQTTALEIMTVAFVFCSVFIYAFSYYLPQDVEFPVILDLREQKPVSEGPAPNPAIVRSVPTTPLDESFPKINGSPGKPDNQKLTVVGPNTENLTSGDATIPLPSIARSATKMPPIAESPVGSPISEENAFKTSAMERFSAHRPPLKESSSTDIKVNEPDEELTRTSDPTSNIEDGSEHENKIDQEHQPGHGEIKADSLPAVGNIKFDTLPEHDVKSNQKGIKHGGTWPLAKSTPRQSPVLRPPTWPTRGLSSEKLPGARADSLPQLQGLSKKMTGMQASKFIPGWIVETIPLTLFEVFACGFGAIHCLGWNSPFPTAKERLAWRICSVSTTALPLVLPPMIPIAMLIDRLTTSAKADDVLDIAMGVLASGIAICYVLGRITLIVLAFMALRALPADTYQTVDWNQYIPHFAAA